MKAKSNVFLLGFFIAFCLIVVDPTSSVSNYQTKPRSTRGFKNAALSTARGFGKRDGFSRNSDPLMDLLFDLNKNPGNEDGPRNPPKLERFSIDWFVEELSKNPRLTRILNKKLAERSMADVEDISSEEQPLRNIVY